MGNEVRSVRACVREYQLLTQSTHSYCLHETLILSRIPHYDSRILRNTYVLEHRYAKDENLFFQDFKNAFEKLLALGCPKQCDVHVKSRRADKSANDEFAEFAMHGSVKRAQELYEKGDVSVNHREASSGRT